MALIAIIDYDMGNLRNVERALVYTGAEVRIVRSPSEAADAAGVVLPPQEARVKMSARLRRTPMTARSLLLCFMVFMVFFPFEIKMIFIKNL